jgi:uncharacterized protein (DUF362 family)
MMGPPRRYNPFVTDGQPVVAIVRVGDDVSEALKTCLRLLGGLDRLLRNGDKVLVKPNLVVASPPPVTTGIDLVKATVRALYEAGAGEVIIGESSLWSTNTRRVMERLGVVEAAREVGARVHPFEEGRWVTVRTQGRWIRRPKVPRILLDVDRVVYLPVLKTHRLAQFSMTLKMAMGIVKPSQRWFMHLYGLRRKIVDVCSAVLPDLSIIDARKCFITGGPMEGEVREPGLLLASGDPVALDVEGVKVIQSFPEATLRGDPWSLTQIRRAVAMGVGARNEEDYRVLRANRIKA